MNQPEHKELVDLEQQGKVLIGVDRQMARRFWTDLPISRIKEKTGEAPYFDKAIVLFPFLCGPIALIASVVFAFFAFRWWGIVYLLICPFVYFIYSSVSVRGGSRILGITALLLVSAGVHFFGTFGVPWITGFATVFLFSLWCARLLYCSSTLLLRCFVIRNARAFRYLSGYLDIRNVK